MNDLSAAVEEISSSTAQLSSLITDAAADGKRGTTAANAARSGMDRIEAETDRTSAEAQSVSAAAQQQASAVAEVSDGVEHLARRTEDLAALLDAFDVRRGAQATGADGPTTGPAVTDGGER
jgi:methyl-accepting chemotaxis protein